MKTSPHRFKFPSNKLYLLLAFAVCLLFITAYSILSIVRHDHYQSYGYDLGINDQTVWRYSRFEPPVNSIHPFPDKTKLLAHVELIYAFISPFYWIWSSRKMLLILDAAILCISGLGVYLLANKKGINPPIALSLMIGYLGFYGIQNTMWFDVHSTSFAAAFLVWFIYFLESKKKIPAFIFFFLAITAKENIALLTFLISVVFFIKERSKLLIFFMLASLAYLFFIFYVYFPYIAQVNYLYANNQGLLSNLNPSSLIDSPTKREVIWYSFLSFGFLPILSPLYLLPVLGHFGTFFVIASDLSGAHGLSMHYHVTLAPLLIWATIVTIAKLKKLQTWHLALYILFFVALAQYLLHLPLSYLSKEWFWTQPSGVKHINLLRKQLPHHASLVAQNNIVPHVSHREKIYSLYPEMKQFNDNSPCKKTLCHWFRWHGNPEFLFIDTSPEWDIRHLLANREDFIEGIKNLEKMNIITKYKQTGNAVLYKVNKNPSEL